MVNDLKNMGNSGDAYCKQIKTGAGNLFSRTDSLLFVLASFALAGCAGTGHLSKNTHVKLEHAPTMSSISRLVDARPVSEKSYRIGVLPGYPESVALGDENFNPDRLRVLGTRLQNALGAKLKDTDEASVERFEVLEYVRDVKTPTAGEIVEGYAKLGMVPPSGVSLTNFSVAEAIALPIAVPMRQMMDRVITSVAEVELRVKINGKSFSSKMAAALPDVDREYGVSEAFELSFKHLVYDLETGLKQ